MPEETYILTPSFSPGLIPLLTGQGTEPTWDNQDLFPTAFDRIDYVRGNIQDIGASGWIENETFDEPLDPISGYYTNRAARAILTSNLPQTIPDEVAINSAHIRFTGSLSWNAAPQNFQDPAALWIGLATQTWPDVYGSDCYMYVRPNLGRIFSNGGLGPHFGSWLLTGYPFSFDVLTTIPESLTEGPPFLNWTNGLHLVVSAATALNFDLGDGNTSIQQASWTISDLEISLILNYSGELLEPEPEPEPPSVGSRLVWNNPGEKVYQAGIDQGVLYLPDGRAVPWNGLMSVDESLDFSNEGVHYDGVKISEVITLGSFSASLSSLSYPEELDSLQGIAPFVSGVYLADQPHRSFGLSYRTKILNDLNPDELGYKINIIYNVFAVPTSRAYSTISDSPEPTEFQWDLVAVPEQIDNYRPSARIVLDTRKMDPELLAEIETILYGDETTNASLISMRELLAYMRTWFRFQVTDNGDGTWTATSDYEDYISTDDPEVGAFVLENVNATYLTDDMYALSDT